MSNASKGLEAFYNIKDEMLEWTEGYEEDLDIVEKELKALEIIRNKEINIHALLLHLKRFDFPDGYNALVGEKYRITQEEYDLLKEVLL